jgi:hypothetical protein
VIRHFQGVYRCIAVTANYSTSSNTCLHGLLIESALTKVILRHPVLCVGIIHEETENPAFVRLDSIDLSTCIEYRDVNASTQDEYNIALQKILERQHSQRWPALHCQTPWKVIVIQSKATPSPKITFDIVFAYHHALADGLSGLIFHRSLLEALNTTEIIENLDRQIAVPKDLTLPPPIEKQYRFKFSIPITLKEWWTDAKSTWLNWPGKSSFWTSTPCSVQNIQNYTSRSQIVTIEAFQLALILPACARQNATLTGLLHGIIVASLASHVPEARKLKAGPAYSLRHLANESSRDEMGVYSWGFAIPYPAKAISRIRSSKTDGELSNQIWDIARAFSASVATELDRLPKGHFIATISCLRNLHGALYAPVGKSRYETFEVSNLGAFKNGDQKEKWQIEKIVFSQSGMGVGPAVSFNVVSVVGGPLTVCATWLQGAIEERLVSLACEDIVHMLNSLSGELGDMRRHAPCRSERLS